MANIETLTAYKCKIKYLQRNNPLIDKLAEKIKSKKDPDYSFNDFVKDFCEYTSKLAVGKSTERAILLPAKNIFGYTDNDKIKRIRIVPLAGKQGKPFHIYKKSSDKGYTFGSDSAALYEHNVFIYPYKNFAIVIFHRQSGSGCKSVFFEVANKMLHDKGIKLEMELYLPPASDNDDIEPVSLQLRYVRSIISSDAPENIEKKKKTEVVQGLELNLKSQEHNPIKRILQDMKIGKIDSNTGFSKIKELCPDYENYNNAEIVLRIGKRQQKIRWGEFDSLLGNYDITERLHNQFKLSHDFIGELTKLTDEYYESIIAEENTDE